MALAFKGRYHTHSPSPRLPSKKKKKRLKRVLLLEVSNVRNVPAYGVKNNKNQSRYPIIPITSKSIAPTLRVTVVCCILGLLTTGCSQTFKNEGAVRRLGEGGWPGLKMAALHRPLYKVSSQGGWASDWGRSSPLPSGYTPDYK